MIMTEGKSNILHFEHFKRLVNWSVAGIVARSITYNQSYKLSPIGSFLAKNTDVIELDDSTIYTQITLKTNNGGVVERGKKRGLDIGTKKQTVVRKGQFVFSKIDARNGAFGIIPDELEGAIVTNDFPVFHIDETMINPSFLLLVTTTKAFVEFAQSCSSGTTNRQRIDVQMFLQQQIPLPSIKKQEKIVSEYNAKIQEACNLGQKADKIEESIEAYITNMLGVKTAQVKENNSGNYLLRFVNYRSIAEWGIDIIQNRQKQDSFKYPIVKIKDLCHSGSGGTPSRSKSQYYSGTIPWIKTGEVINDVILDTEEHITKEAIANSSAKLYPKGSLIIAMYGQGDTRGRTAKLGIDATTNQACAVLYDIDNSIVTTDYLWYYLQSRYHDLRSLASGNNQPNLNAGKIKNYDVVIPPLAIQNEIATHIEQQKSKAKELKQKAQAMREAAIKEFENTLL
ncbi:MAG: restriction endonuclease subunit S [Muribaculaceae bacterium]|nr:restriction endonuclease subunit S [Muribaculaceae bacterium]